MVFKESSPKDCDQLGLESTFKTHVSLWQKKFTCNYDAWICYLFLPTDDTGLSVDFLSVTLDSNNFTGKESFQEGCWLWKGSMSYKPDLNLSAWQMEGVHGRADCRALVRSPGLSALSDSLLLCSQGPVVQREDVSAPYHSLWWPSVSSTQQSRDWLLEWELSSQSPGAWHLCFNQPSRCFWPTRNLRATAISRPWLPECKHTNKKQEPFSFKNLQNLKTFYLSEFISKTIIHWHFFARWRLFFFF